MILTVLDALIDTPLLAIVDLQFDSKPLDHIRKYFITLQEMLMQSVLIWCRNPCSQIKHDEYDITYRQTMIFFLVGLECFGAIVYKRVEPTRTMNLIAEMTYLKSGWECKIQKILITGYSSCQFRLVYWDVYPFY